LFGPLIKYLDPEEQQEMDSEGMYKIDLLMRIALQIDLQDVQQVSFFTMQTCHSVQTTSGTGLLSHLASAGSFSAPKIFSAC
jgi:regulator of RNase E activity RraB